MRFVVQTAWMRLHRFSPLLLVFTLLLSACGGDDEGDDSTPVDDQTKDDGFQVSEGVEGDEDDDESGDEGSEGEGDEGAGDFTDVTEAVEDDGDGVDETGIDVDPIADVAVINDMVEEANADGEVTGEEISEILEAASETPEAQADCEGAILAELGITDPTDLDQLQAAGAAMTEEQRVALSTCIAGG